MSGDRVNLEPLRSLARRVDERIDAVSACEARTRAAASPELPAPPRRRVLIVVAAAVVVVVALLLVRSTTGSDRSVLVPPAQRHVGPAPDADVRLRDCLGGESPDQVGRYHDHATGQTVEMTLGQWCAELLVAQPYDSEELQRAGLSSAAFMENGHPSVRYQEELSTGSASIITKTEVPADEVERRVEALRRTPVPTLPDSADRCQLTTTSDPCNRSPAEARSLLGFTVKTPSDLPDGFQLATRDLLPYPAADPSDPNRTVFMYKQVWAPPMSANPSQTAQTPPYVMLRQRLATLPGDDNPCDNDRRTVLADGSIACGSLTWVKDGVWYSLSGSEVDDDELVRIANSLR